MFVQHTNLADAEADARKLVCYDCGIACDLGAMREERLVYLRKLGADQPRPAPVSPLSPVILSTAKPCEGPPCETDVGTSADRGILRSAQDDKKKKQQGSNKRPPVTFSQGTPVRYRFGYTKLGPSALLSHLDLIRALPRALRRVDLPLYYSTGFHPKPDMTFGPALSLGISSLAEVVDVRLTAEIDPEAWLDELSRASSEGMRFYAARRLGEGDASVSRIVDTARYAIALPESVLASHGGDAWLRARVEHALAAPELQVRRTIEGIGRWVDVRAFLRAIELGSPAARRAIDEAGFVGAFAVLEVDLEIRGSGAIKVAEVVEAVTGLADFPHRAVRFGLGAWRNCAVTSPFDLDTVRVRAPAVVSLAVI
jgi:radical SAM-linked protein